MLRKSFGDNPVDFLSLLFLGGSFLIALLTYIDRTNKRK
ncbi:MAG: putative holin-like toxin [Oliverpabstia sp.]